MYFNFPMIYISYTYVLYHITEIKKWRQDRRCGTDYLLPDGTPAQCNPAGPLGPQQAGPCCSEYGYCGSSPGHCECANCMDYRTGKTFQNVKCQKKV